MTILGLSPLAAGATVLDLDNREVVIKQWMIKIAVPVMMAVAGFTWRQFDGRLTRLEQAPTSAIAIQALDQRVSDIEKLVAIYEQLRMQRERQITELQTEQRFIKDTVDQMRGEMNRKLDRLLVPR